MQNYIFVPGEIGSGRCAAPEQAQWLGDWLNGLYEDIEHGIVSSAECVQGLLSEIMLYGGDRLDWLSVEHDLLRDEQGSPMAYSRAYGRQLYKFEGQWKQMPVHAVYNSFWLSVYYEQGEEEKYRALIEDLIQPSGWIYNRAVSDTGLRTRMKSELLMSLAMGTEILGASGLTEERANHFEAALAALPLTGYVSAEYFRWRALQNIGREYQMPNGIGEMLEKCEAGPGYNDFCIADKTDDYMGTKKRTQHDTAIHTPLVSGMALEIAHLGGQACRQHVEERMERYAAHLKKAPLDIPAFTMRDIDLPFGAGITPLEVIASVMITDRY